mgnify:CR=1 FL=1|jgi:hypothetical protein
MQGDNREHPDDKQPIKADIIGVAVWHTNSALGLVGLSGTIIVVSHILTKLIERIVDAMPSAYDPYNNPY